MIYGLSENGERVSAKKNVEASCPGCKADLVPKCGPVKVHHWAHKEAKNCIYATGMTQWHYSWFIYFKDLSSEGWEIEYFNKSINIEIVSICAPFPVHIST